MAHTDLSTEVRTTLTAGDRVQRTADDQISFGIFPAIYFMHGGEDKGGLFGAGQVLR